MICLLACLTQARAQAVLRGQVNDGSTGEGLAYATVYFDGTGVGAVTDETGGFAVRLPRDFRLPRELRVSFVGYGSLSAEITTARAPVRFELAPAQQRLVDVEVGGVDRRAENLAEFRRHLLGTDGWAMRTSVDHEDRLFFSRERVRDTLRAVYAQQQSWRPPTDLEEAEWLPGGTHKAYSRDVRFEVTADGPLTVSLPHLGYELDFDLGAFVLDYDTERYSYTAGKYFKDLLPEGGTARRRILRNRRRAYYGSQMHFLRALYHNAVDTAGFLVREVLPDTSGKPRRLRTTDLEPFLERDSVGRLDLSALIGKSFIVLYYGGRQGRPVPRDRRERHRPRQSQLYVLGPGPVRADGTVPSTDLAFLGDIGRRALSWALPAEYDPEVE